jgi:threonine synthase
MRYISTRGRSGSRDFDDVLLAGLAPDGGLFLPESYPEFSAADWRALRGLPYADMAARVMFPFLGGAWRFETFHALVEDSYRDFGHPAVAPLVQVDERRFILELFHGPTLAFKDVAMQFLGRMFDHVLEARDQRITIVGATSGDTGSAAIAAVAGLSRARITMLHPEGRVSPVQRRQMTTVDAPNVTNLAVAGSFDDCQDLVKAMFADADFRAEMNLSAVNSINWARVVAQVPYYVAAALALGAPDRQFRQRAGRLGRRPHGPADRAPGGWHQPQRHPGPLPGRQRHAHRRRRTQPFAQHGHPGEFQLRAPAVRTAGPRRCAHRGDHAGLPRHRPHAGARRRLACRHPGFCGLRAG